MKNEWTMAAFLAEHDKKWEAEIADLKAKLNESNEENIKLKQEIDRLVTELSGQYDGKLASQIAKG